MNDGYSDDIGDGKYKTACSKRTEGEGAVMLPYCFPAFLHFARREVGELSRATCCMQNGPMPMRWHHRLVPHRCYHPLKACIESTCGDLVRSPRAKNLLNA